MKVRIGFGLGSRTPLDGPAFAHAVDELERLRFDSLWLTERLRGPGPDPLVGMAMAAARTSRLKVGTSVLVLPGRNPVVLARELASLDVLSGGRVLPAVGLGAVDPHEQSGFGVSRTDRASVFDEALEVLRRLWTEDAVTHHGTWFHLDEVTIEPKPLQQPIDVWLGGLAPSELRRVGRLGDGWLPSFCTPEDVRRGWQVIGEAASSNGRSLDPEHVGALIAYRTGPLAEPYRSFVATRRPDVAPEVLVPAIDDLPSAIDAFTSVGASKFVVLPLDTPPPDAHRWTAELERLAADLLPLQT